MAEGRILLGVSSPRQPAHGRRCRPLQPRGQHVRDIHAFRQAHGGHRQHKVRLSVIIGSTNRDVCGKPNCPLCP